MFDSSGGNPGAIADSMVSGRRPPRLGAVDIVRCHDDRARSKPRARMRHNRAVRSRRSRTARLNTACTCSQLSAYDWLVSPPPAASSSDGVRPCRPPRQRPNREARVDRPGSRYVGDRWVCAATRRGPAHWKAPRRDLSRARAAAGHPTRRQLRPAGPGNTAGARRSDGAANNFRSPSSHEANAKSPTRWMAPLDPTSDTPPCQLQIGARFPDAASPPSSTISSGRL